MGGGRSTGPQTTGRPPSTYLTSGRGMERDPSRTTWSRVGPLPVRCTGTPVRLPVDGTLRPQTEKHSCVLKGVVSATVSRALGSGCFETRRGRGTLCGKILFLPSLGGLGGRRRGREDGPRRVVVDENVL